MRQGHDNSILVIDGKTIAVNLGSDYCAEHEWGIKGIRRAFGMTDEGFGLDRRIIRNIPDTLRWATGESKVWHDADAKHKRGRNVKTLWEGFWLPFWSKSAEPRDINFFSSRTLWTGWSECDFAAFSTSVEEQKALKEIYDAFMAGDGAIWLGGGGVFKNAGLVIGVASRLSSDVVASWDKHDRDHHQLSLDAEATGIFDRLKKAGLSYFALSPRRDEDGTIKFWLNPIEQDIHNFGWFTVADLDDWIAGKGKVIKGKDR